MPTVIIIGFQYDTSEKELSSMVTDIYIVYSFYRKLGYRVYIASDAQKVKISPDFTRLLVDGVVDEGYMDFVNGLFIPLRHKVLSKDDLTAFFDAIELTTDRRLIFYYTGHGETKGILLPDTTTLPAIEFRAKLFGIQKFSSDDQRGVSVSMRRGINSNGAQLFIIMDCCNSHGFYLPYRLMGNKYIDQSSLYICPEVILLASSDIDSPAIAHVSESPFTRELFGLLRDNKQTVDLPTIVKKLTEKTTAHVSYPSTYVMWPWTFTNKIDCQINEFMDAIVVQRE